MAKPEWGTKRICLSCGSRFYDLQRDPIVCPSCEASFKPDDFLRTRRTRAQAEEAPRPKPAPAKAKKAAALDELDESGDELESESESEGESESVMEDTSELGEDDDDVAEVIENVEGEDEESSR